MSSSYVGQIIAGKYRVERVIGEGGMGIVLEAMHLQLDQRVALKVLAGEALKNEEAVARFQREARAAARIQSEHVVRVFDVAELENGTPYLVMEYLEGCDLEAILHYDGALEPVNAVTYVLQACEALAEAHTNGIVHRDLKPANLFLADRADGSLIIKILDFGVSKLQPKGSANEVRVTRTMSIVGSPLYMAPEQMRGAKSADLRADIWSLGIILYELLTGVPPFEGESLTEVCAAIVMDPPRPLAATRPDLSPALEAVVMRCLEKDPTRRYQDVGELARALEPFAPEQGAISVKRAVRVIHRADVRASASAHPAPRRTPLPRDASLSYLDQLKITIPEVPEERRSSQLFASTVASFGITGRGERKGLSPVLFAAAGGGALSILAAISLMSVLRSGNAPAAAAPQIVAPQVQAATAPDPEPVVPPPIEAAPSASAAPAPPAPPANPPTRSERSRRKAREAEAELVATKGSKMDADAGVTAKSEPAAGPSKIDPSAAPSVLPTTEPPSELLTL